MELYTAFILGFFGGLHCIGMCGPIVIALPIGGKGGVHFLISRLLYNLGRVVTYVLFGLLVGLLAKGVSLAGYQQVLSIILGSLIVLGVLLPKKWTSRLFPMGSFTTLSSKVKQLWARMFGKGSLSALFVIGILNGFLPCGLVYTAVAGAGSTGSVEGGMAYMALFGVGTIPALLVTSYAGKLIGIGFRRRLLKLIPVAALVLGVLLILRGMNLGIPYISPKAGMKHGNHGQTEQTMECCHPGE
ncbi:sulfite exporter TauE/SafE family protein [bacterium]|nr:sulfite exporter TauE/SafE family protein [bacterium]